MALLDKPVSMNELGAAVVQDIGAVAQTKLSQEKSDLTAVWESMYSKGLGRKVSSQCYYTPEEIEKAQREEQEKANEDRERVIHEQHEPAPEVCEAEAEGEKMRDLASVHFERALNTGMAHMHTGGRHFRRRRTLSGEFSNSVPMPRSPRTSRHRSSEATCSETRKSFAL